MDHKDIVEIEQLMALYSHAVDNSDQGLLPLVFTEDAVWASAYTPPDMPENAYRGLPAIIEFFSLGIPPHSPTHQTMNVWVREENGQTLVRSKWIAHPEEEKIWMGDYDDVVVRTPNGWRIKHRLVKIRFPR
jgi:hypothetical protein